MSVNERVRQKQETRAALLEAARRCFAEKGWSETVVADVVRAAGVAHGTFYVHFRDKDAIGDALLGEFNVALAARVAPALERAAEEPEARVRAAARAFLATLAAERAFVGWYAERLALGASGETFFGGINPEARVLLDTWLDRTGVDATQRPLLVHGLLALWIRIGLRTVLADEKPKVAEEVIVRATVGAIGAFVEPTKKKTRAR